MQIILLDNVSCALVLQLFYMEGLQAMSDSSRSEFLIRVTLQ